MADLVPNIIAALAVALSAATWWVDRRRGKQTRFGRSHLPTPRMH